MAASTDNKRLTQTLLGLRVDRAAANLPATTSTNYFAVTGGRVLITQIYGEVTTIIQAQANNIKLISTPTTGTAVDMCAVVESNGKEAGTLLGITGLPADAMVATNAGLTQAQNRALIIPIGNIKFSAAATSTGATKWQLYYFPLDPGAAVAAV